jgi:hypothetical protein
MGERGPVTFTVQRESAPNDTSSLWRLSRADRTTPTGVHFFGGLPLFFVADTSALGWSK